MVSEPQQDPLLGSVLEGRFQLERLLGEGGMGRVYVADELRLRRRCAVKVLQPELMEDQDCVERFLREAQAIAQIHHENVVEIYHLGENHSAGVVFFAMEMLVGKDLESHLYERASRPLSWQQITRWMAQVASAMAAVHATGMIHRDLKPSNVFIDTRRGRDQVKLLDFGIAKTANTSALTSTGAALGTPYYMSPEQILAQPLDSRTDIYSFGVLFFEALAGRMPFVGEPLQVAMQHCNLAMPAIADIAPDTDVPPELEDLIQRMLAKDREARVQTMEEIEGFLHDLLVTHGVSVVERPGPTGPVATPATIPPRRAPSHASDTAVTLPTLASAPASSQPFTAAEPAAARPAARPLILLLAGVTALGALVVFLLLGDREARTPPAEPAGQLTTAEPARTPELAPIVGTLPVGATQAPAAPDHTTGGADPEPVPPEPTPDDPKVRKPAVARSDKPADPLRQIRKAADACRKTHKAIKGPLITIDYATASDGTVTRAVPTVKDALGKCLADAVRAAKFAPQLKLGLKLQL